jgi:hypothetical protein
MSGPGPSRRTRCRFNIRRLQRQAPLASGHARCALGATTPMATHSRFTIGFALSMVLGAGAACGSGDEPTTTPDAAAVVDATSRLEATAPDAPDDGGAGEPAADAAPPFVPCPRVPPLDGGACATTSEECSYLDCASYGELTAVCSASRWRLTSLPCPADASPPCSGLPGGDEPACARGEICQLNQGGAIWVTCVKNTCEAGLLSCDCLPCNGCQLSGFQIDCNLCPQGGCP